MLLYVCHKQYIDWLPLVRICRIIDCSRCPWCRLLPVVSCHSLDPDQVVLQQIQRLLQVRDVREEIPVQGARGGKVGVS